MAAEEGHVDIVEYLIDNEADIGIQELIGVRVSYCHNIFQSNNLNNNSGHPGHLGLSLVLMQIQGCPQSISIINSRTRLFLMWSMSMSINSRSKMFICPSTTLLLRLPSTWHVKILGPRCQKTHASDKQLHKFTTSYTPVSQKTAHPLLLAQFPAGPYPAVQLAWF